MTDQNIPADIIQYGIRVEFPDRKFGHPMLGHRGVWTTDKALAEHELTELREQDQLRDANIRLVARRVSPTWEVQE